MRAARPSDAISRTRLIRTDSGSSIARASPVGKSQRWTLSTVRRPNGAAAKILPQRFGQKRHERRDQFGRGQQTFVKRPIGVALVAADFVGRPKSIAAAADIPIRKCIDELDKLPAGGVVVVGIHRRRDRGGGAVQFAQNPAIQFAALFEGRKILGPRQARPAPIRPRRRQAQLRSSAGSKPSILA